MRIRKAICFKGEEDTLPYNVSAMEEWLHALGEAETAFDAFSDDGEKALAVFNDKWREDCIWVMAENMLCEKGVIPPHWTKVINCQNCGPMPGDEEYDEELVACPWCHTAFGGQATARKSLDYLEHERTQRAWRKKL